MKLLMLLTSSFIFFNCGASKSEQELKEDKEVLVEFIMRLEQSEGNPHHENIEKEKH